MLTSYLQQIVSYSIQCILVTTHLDCLRCTTLITTEINCPITAIANNVVAKAIITPLLSSEQSSLLTSTENNTV